jgi:hypothetical protein
MGFCSCRSVSQEDAQMQLSKRRAEEEQTLKAMRNSPIQPEGIKGIESIDKLDRQR